MSAPDSPEAAVRPDALQAGAVFRRLAADFARAGLATPGLDARLIVCAACRLSHEAFAARPERPVAAEERARIEALRARRLEGEPVSRLTGRREFRGLDFALTPATLDPRPDTETVVEAALELAREEGTQTPAILDLGTGTGCLLLSLLHALPGAVGAGCDIDPAAVRAARANAAAHGLGERAHFFCGSWLEAVAGGFDLVVANPPYIPAGGIDRLAPEVARFEPRAALDGGADGLDAYRAISPRLSAVLRPRGWAVFETGAGCDGAVLEILHRHGLARGREEARTWRDLAGHVRCLAARAP